MSAAAQTGAEPVAGPVGAPVEGPVFPPLFHGRAATEPFAEAVAAARAGCDAGLVLFDIRLDTLRAAVVFAPEVPLSEAVVMLPLCGVAFQNAFGSHAPPEVAVHLGWDGALRINGAVAGRLGMAADRCAPDAEPGWLVIGLELALIGIGDAPGASPDRTTLFDEGCAGMDPVALLESWVRHVLLWVNTWSGDGLREMHREWAGLAHGLNEAVPGRGGVFIGVDDRFGMLLKHEGGTRAVPLTDLLEETP